MDILNELHSITKLNGDTYSSAEVLGAVNRAAFEITRLRLALRIIAGREQCMDNLMGNVDIACEALDK